MLRRLSFGLVAIGLFSALSACSGDTGEDGKNGLAGINGRDGENGNNGENGRDGTDGQDGQDATLSPSINAVFPNVAKINRRVEVLISGYGTEWDSTSSVDFGPNVTVHQVRRASPTALIVTLESDTDVELAPRDISVTTGANTLVLEKAFSFSPTLKQISRPLGRAAQGGIFQLAVANIDPENPILGGGSSEGLSDLLPVEFEVVAPAGIQGDAYLDSSQGIVIYFAIDADAPVGSFPIHIVARVNGEEISLYEPLGIEIAARSPIPITSAETELSFEHGSDFVYATVQAPSSGTHIVEVRSEAPDYRYNYIYTMGKNGKFPIPFSSNDSAYNVLEADELWHLSVGEFNSYNIDPEASYAATLYRNQIPATHASPAEPNNDDTEATELTLPAVVAGGTFSSETDEDWFKFTVSDADSGKKLIVRNYEGTEVYSIFELQPLGGSFNEVSDWNTTTVNAGDYYLRAKFPSYMNYTASDPNIYNFYVYLD